MQSVTLGDDEARTRGTQKTILERKAPPTFPVVIEMRGRGLYVAHWAQDSVDALLLGRQPMVQVGLCTCNEGNFMQISHTCLRRKAASLGEDIGA